MNSDGFADVIVGATDDDNNGLGDSGSARIFLAPTLPVLTYKSQKHSGTSLKLEWIPDNGDINSMTGTLTANLASPGGLGIIGVSLAPADLLIYGFPLLIANDPVNLLLQDSFVYNIVGEKIVPSITRINPFIAGSLLHFQFFETSPNVAASNGVRFLVVP